MKIFFIISIMILMSINLLAQNYDPCKDPKLKSLEVKDSLSESETELYLELRKLCDKSVADKSNQELKQQEVDALTKNAESVETATNTYSAWLWVGGILTVVCLLIALAASP